MNNANAALRRTAVVTGASAGIGAAVARRLAAERCRVVVNARRKQRLDELVSRLNAGQPETCAVGVPGDASDQSVIDEMLDTARDRFGAEADAVVVNAGRGLAGSVFNSDPAQWEEMIRTNLLGAARLMRAAARRMTETLPDDNWLERARDIVVLGSNVGRHISPFSSMYGSTKFAVNSLAEALRRELAPRGVRVTLVEPGIVRSEFQQVAGYDPETFGQFMDRVGPVLEPEDVARTLWFILSQPVHVHINNVLIRPTRQDYP